MRIYLKEKRALAYFNQRATAEYWDAHWQRDDLRRYIWSYTSDGLFIPLIQKYLPAGSTILEGGCGQGQYVHALQCHHYTAVGIDFAPKTVQRVHEAVPELHICLGDVRKLPIHDGALQGYLSIGVIEHFWEGYQVILQEMRRTLAPGGYLFLSFPYMSPLRKLKVKMGCYRMGSAEQYQETPPAFYQFVLPREVVVQDLRALGFAFQEVVPWDGIKGLKDEFTRLKPLLQPIYDGKMHPGIRPLLDRFCTPFAAHSLILVMKKDRS